jgi:CDP-diacylglycerol--glycerol-3-phosphate 3-phosphatidyltransferase
VTVTDVLSALRIALALLIAGAATVLFTPGVPTLLLFVFLVGVATDIVGAMLARGHETLHGRVLDSLADKALVYSVLLPLARSGFPPLFLLQLLMARDAVAVALQVVAARRGQELRVGQLGRVKTAILDMACAALLTLTWLQSSSSPVHIDPGDLGTILPFLLISQLAIAVGLLLSFVTLFRYILTLRSSRPV